jgi:hypothetical protein
LMRFAAFMARELSIAEVEPSSCSAFFIFIAKVFGWLANQLASLLWMPVGPHNSNSRREVDCFEKDEK